MTKKLEVKLSGFLKTTGLDKHGTKKVTFEFSAKDSLEIARLELMSRDLVDHLPVLLNLTITEGCTDGAKKNKKRDVGDNKPKHKGSFAG